MYAVFDCETQGLPDFRAPSDAPHQPHLVQLAMILFDTGHRERAAVSVIVKPDGWSIPAEVAAIHGIDDEIAAAFGVPEKLAVEMFLYLSDMAGMEVAHNLSFDRRIMRIAMLRHGLTREIVELREARPSFCTMKAATPIVNAPPTEKMLRAGFTKPKSANLGECMRHFFSEDLVGAHDAMVDARACARLYRALTVLPAEVA